MMRNEGVVDDILLTTESALSAADKEINTSGLDEQRLDDDELYDVRQITNLKQQTC